MITYETVLGSERTIPEIRARDIELRDGGQSGGESQPPADESTPRSTSEASEPDPQTFSGSGQTVIDDVEIIGGLTIVEGHHTGSRNFSVQFVSPNKDSNQIFINEIGTYDGAAADQIEADTYQIDVTADGSWELTVRQPRPNSGDSLPQSLSGQGPVVRGPFSFQGTHTASGNHSGERNFQIIIFPPEGDFGEIVFNEVGEFEGETTFQHSGVGFVDITADGNWDIELE